MSNIEPSDGTIVSVTSQGQATIPKEFREKLNLQTPGRVKFREDDEGNITIEQVRDIRDFQGIATGERSLTAALRAEREREYEREEQTAADFSEAE
jgi:AbrB family looped-hinge helix DNA binding protein